MSVGHVTRSSSEGEPPALKPSPHLHRHKVLKADVLIKAPERGGVHGRTRKRLLKFNDTSPMTTDAPAPGDSPDGSAPSHNESRQLRAIRMGRRLPSDRRPPRRALAGGPLIAAYGESCVQMF